MYFSFCFCVYSCLFASKTNEVSKRWTKKPNFVAFQIFSDIRKTFFILFCSKLSYDLCKPLTVDRWPLTVDRCPLQTVFAFISFWYPVFSYLKQQKIKPFRISRNVSNAFRMSLYTEKCILIFAFVLIHVCLHLKGMKYWKDGQKSLTL